MSRRFDLWVGKIPRRRNGNPLQYSCLGNLMDGGAWWAAVHGAKRSSTRLKYAYSGYHIWSGVLLTVSNSQGIHLNLNLERSHPIRTLVSLPTVSVHHYGNGDPSFLPPWLPLGMTVAPSVPSLIFGPVK